MTVRSKGVWRLAPLGRGGLPAALAVQLPGAMLLAALLAGAPLRDDGGQRHYSFPHRPRFTYAAGEETEAVLALTSATGRGLSSGGAFRSEFGHLPDSLYVSIQIVF